ncbi:urease [Podospora didyma]|uniref:Urease n=1 Tax=Podospora didyma TaxID=330526 RepID=A0AAE0NDB9_9PEZI|nr:urease [Podospora didyma]
MTASMDDETTMMGHNSNDKANQDAEIENEIAELERRLAEAKTKRRQRGMNTRSEDECIIKQPLNDTPSRPLLNANNSNNSSAQHFLLLLSDSALPLGSFAFSSGLESYLAHSKAGLSPSPLPGAAPGGSFSTFLPLSISSYASTTLPFLLAAHRDPSFASIVDLDDALDATIICTVGRRASIAQGRALLSIWDRSFAAGFATTDEKKYNANPVAAATLKPFVALLKTSSSSDSTTGNGGAAMPPPVAAHLAPLFGAICNLVGLSLEQTAYVFMLGHVKALVSAAVRAGMFGPYQAQMTLAGGTVQGLITAMIEREWDTPIKKAGQRLPVMDLWFGRHEVLYSRIFNS